MILLAGVLAIGLACAKPPDDSQLTSQIQSKLNEDSGLHGKPITVRTSGGVVTISGTVENETQREAAARYASAIPGIKEVVNNLQTASMAAMAAPNPMGQTLPPAGESSPAKLLPAKPRPSTPHHRTDSDSREMSANAPPPAVPDEAAPEEQPAPAAQPAPPPPPSAKQVTVPSETSMAIRLIDPIDSEKAQPGQTFRATLDAPLPSDGELVPSGYEVKGHIEDVKSAGKFAGQSLLVLQLDSISVSGKSYDIDADLYRRQGKNRSTNTAEKVGGGAVLGAILGGIIGGGKGAGVGAAAGGGLGGATQAASKGQPIQLPSETVLTFTLRSPLTVTLVDKGPDSGRQKLDAPR